MRILLVVQTGTFLVMGFRFLWIGQWRLGTAQLLLAVVQALIYSGTMA